MIRQSLFVLALLAVLAIPLTGQSEAPSDPYERLDPMDVSGLERSLANVLERYYAATFGGPENWADVESMHYEGVLSMDGQELDFAAFKKRPNLTRVRLTGANGARLTSGFDGQDAWQLIETRGNELPTVQAMPEAEARGFERDAVFGSHLLYPQLPGKKMHFAGINEIDGRRFYEIAVTLPDGQNLRFLLDPTRFLEVRQIIENSVSGAEQIIEHSDFRNVEGVQIPFQSVMTEAGELKHTSRLTQVRINSGTASWMFRRPDSGF
jgi:hypothetical protein